MKSENHSHISIITHLRTVCKQRALTRNTLAQTIRNTVKFLCVNVIHITDRHYVTLADAAKCITTVLYQTVVNG